MTHHTTDPHVKNCATHLQAYIPNPDTKQRIVCSHLMLIHAQQKGSPGYVVELPAPEAHPMVDHLVLLRLCMDLRATTKSFAAGIHRGGSRNNQLKANKMPYMDWPALPVPPGRPADSRVEVGVVEVCMGGVQLGECAPRLLQVPVGMLSLFPGRRPVQTI